MGEISRAKELELIEGKKIAFDFHFKRFFGSHSKEKGLGKGPDKAGNMVAGFRPHVTWDLVANTVLSMNYYHGGVRAPGILEQYCDPQKVEFEFYCTLVSRLSYEYFLKELGGEYYHQQNGNKTTLQKMRNLFFEKRNFTLEQASDDNFVMTIFDGGGNDLERSVATLLNQRMENGKNKVL